MINLLPSPELITEIETAEIDFMSDRMNAIQERPGNPEGIEIARFGSAACYYSRTMAWPAFNTVKGITSESLPYLEQIIEFYRARNRKAQFEIIPARSDQKLLMQLSKFGFYQSGFHSSLVAAPSALPEQPSGVLNIREVQEDKFDLYATIHCRATGLPDSGIPHVAQNNKALHNRPGWTFYMAYVNGAPAAAGVCYIKHGRASLTFAATLPEYRKQGLQKALLQKRMEHAALSGCRLVVGQCAFLSQSHRNMERAGMKLGYVRATWSEQ